LRTNHPTTTDEYSPLGWRDDLREANDMAGGRKPTGLALAQTTIEVTEDGHAKIGIKATWNAVPAAPSYAIEITQVSTGEVSTDSAADPTYIFDAKSAKQYSVRVASVSKLGKRSNWSSAVTLTPSKKSAAPTAPSGFSITTKAKMLKGAWTQPSDADIRRYEWYVNTANNQTGGVGIVKAGNGDHFVYGEELTVGTAYYVFIRSIDRSGNPSAWVAANNNPQTYRGAQTADIGTGQITDALTSATIGTPSAPTVAQTTKSTNGDGTIDMGLKISVASLPSEAYALVFKIDEYLSDNTTLVDTYYVHPRKLVGKYTGVIADHYYRVSAAGVGFNNHEGSFSSVTTLQATAKTTAPTAPTVTSCQFIYGFTVQLQIAVPSEKDIATVEVVLKATNVTPTSSDITWIVSPSSQYSLLFNLITPGQGGWYFVRYINRSGVPSSWTSGPIANLQLNWSNTDIGTNSIAQAQMQDNSVGTAEIIDANVTTAKLSSTAVSDKMAGAAVGSKGSYAFFKYTAATTLSAGDTTAGSNLNYSDTALGSIGSSPSGTWQCNARVTQNQGGVFLRVS